MELDEIELQVKPTKLEEIDSHEKKQKSSSVPVILNALFTTEGGDSNKNQQRIGNILSALNFQTHTVTSNSYAVFEFTKDFFTLTHFAIRGAGIGATSPLKDGLLWIRSVPPPKDFFMKYENFTIEQFNSMERSFTDDEPIIYFQTDPNTLYFQCELPNHVVGKYVYLMFLSKHATGGNSIDIDRVYFCGYDRKQESFVHNNTVDFYKNYPLTLNCEFPTEMNIGVPIRNFPILNGEYTRKMEVPIGKFNAVHVESDLLFVAAEVYIRAWSMENGQLIYETNVFETPYLLNVNQDIIHCFTFNNDLIKLDTTSGKILDSYSGLEGVTKILRVSSCVWVCHQDGNIDILNWEVFFYFLLTKQ